MHSYADSERQLDSGKPDWQSPSTARIGGKEKRPDPLGIGALAAHIFEPAFSSAGTRPTDHAIILPLVLAILELLEEVSQIRAHLFDPLLVTDDGLLFLGLFESLDGKTDLLVFRAEPEHHCLDLLTY